MGHASPITGKTKTTQLSPSPDRQEHPSPFTWEMLGTLEQKYTVYKLEIHTLLLGLSDVFDVFSDIFVNIFICRSIRLRSVYIGAAWIPAIKLALFTFISLQRFTPMPTRIGNSFSKSKNIFFGQNSWRAGRTCWLSSAKGGRVTPQQTDSVTVFFRCRPYIA